MGRAKLNWKKNTYTPEEDIPDEYNDYHAQGIGALTGGRQVSDLVIHKTIEVKQDKETVIHG